MKIKFDNKELVVENPNDNIVEIAEKNGINIVAPCFRNKNKYGCCGGCLIKVNGENKYACSTKPSIGMEIIYDTPELKEFREKNLKNYSSNIKNNNYSCNSCKCNSNNILK